MSEPTDLINPHLDNADGLGDWLRTPGACRYGEGVDVGRWIDPYCEGHGHGLSGWDWVVKVNGYGAVVIAELGSYRNGGTVLAWSAQEGGGLYGADVKR